MYFLFQAVQIPTQMSESNSCSSVNSSNSLNNNNSMFGNNYNSNSSSSGCSINANSISSNNPLLSSSLSSLPNSKQNAVNIGIGNQLNSTPLNENDETRSKLSLYLHQLAGHTVSL